MLSRKRGATMKVFISWSGALSHEVAVVLRDWLPVIIQATEPYVSSEDIDKGARWITDVSQELEHSRYGILCITPENVHAPWINFEAGALSKSLDRSHVVPFLFHLDRSDVTGPLVQFQSVIFEKEDIRKLVRSLNRASAPSGIDESRLDTSYDVWWPHLEEKLSKLSNRRDETTEQTTRTTHDIVAEILELVRGQSKAAPQPTNRAFDDLWFRARGHQLYQQVYFDRLDRQVSLLVQSIRSQTKEGAAEAAAQANEIDATLRMIRANEHEFLSDIIHSDITSVGAPNQATSRAKSQDA